MICLRIIERNIENLFIENKKCSLCFELQEVVIGYDKHFIVHNDNLITLALLEKIYGYLLIDSFDFEVLEAFCDIGPLIIYGNNFLNCQGMLPIR